MVIDQSGRIEETNRASIIALADKKRSFTLKITANLKRKIQSIFREKGKPKVFPIIVFATAVYYAIEKSRYRFDILIIDNEYPGHNPAIKNIILQHYRDNKRKEPEIYFSSIGKNDPAHIVAIETFRGKRKPDVTARWSEFLSLLK